MQDSRLFVKLTLGGLLLATVGFASPARGEHRHHASPLLAAADRFHDAADQFHHVIDDFGPTPIEHMLAAQLQSLACNLQSRLERCSSPTQVKAELRRVRYVMAQLDARMEHYCRSELHPSIRRSWHCLSEAWSALNCLADGHHAPPPVSHNPQQLPWSTWNGQPLPQTQWNGPANYPGGFQGLGTPAAFATPRPSTVYYTQPPQPQDVRAVLINSFLQRLLDQ